MSDYLSADCRQRIGDLAKKKNLTQAELAKLGGVDEGTLSKFMKGITQTLKHEVVISLACNLGVTTDFLLGLSNVPDRTNYEVEELGLSVQAAYNLYTGKLDKVVVNRLLESPDFPLVIRNIRMYLDHSLANGILSVNALYDRLASIAMAQRSPEAAKDILLTKVDPKSDLSRVNKAMRFMLERIRDRNLEEVAANNLTSDLFLEMQKDLMSKRGKHYREPTAEEFADAVMKRIPPEYELRSETRKQIRLAITMLAEDLPNVSW